MENQHQEQEGEQAITSETVQQFNRVCQQATNLMLSYKQQSEDLKGQITSMVTMYNKTADPSQAVPIDKIMEITSTYETEMRSAQDEYQQLQKQLISQQTERNGMLVEINDCFLKLEKMEKVLRAKKQAKVKQQNKQLPKNQTDAKQQQPNSSE